MKIKIKEKRANMKLLAMLYQYWWLVGIILLIYFGFMQTGTILSSASNACPLSWDFSYDPSTGIMTIPITTDADTVDCIGPNQLVNSGSNSIRDSATCNEIGFSWNDAEHECLINQDWFTGKSYDSDFTCTHSIGESPAYHVKSRFDGFTIGISTGFSKYGLVKRQDDDSVSCTGNIYVQIKSIAGSPSIPGAASNPAAESSPTTKIVECVQNLDCRQACGTKTPTCTNEKCFCEGVETKNPEPITLSEPNLSIFGRIISFIQNIFDKIFSIFSK